MIDALIELVMDPSGRRAPEHIERPVDQIVVVEQAAFLFLTAIVGRDRRGNVHEGLGPVADRGSAALFHQNGEPRGLPIEGRSRRRMLLDDALSDGRLPEVLVLGQEQRQDGLTCALPLMS